EKTRLFLSIFEHETGTLVCPVIEFPALHIRHTLLVQHLSKKLAVAKREGAVSAAVETIEKALPALEQYAAMPPEHYTLYHQFYQADTPPKTKGALPTITVAQAPDYAYNSKADIVVFLMENTQISAQSLQWVQHHAAQNPDASLFYGSYIMSSQGRPDYPVFNAAFDSDLFLQQPANARAYAVRQHHLEETGGIASGTPEDHLAVWLHLLARHGETAFHPVPEAIWQIDTAPNGTKKAEGTAPNEDGDENGAISAVNDHFSAIKNGAVAKEHSDRYGGPVPDALTIEWPIDSDLPKLAIIIPTRDALALVRGCVESLRKTLRHPEATEIIIMDNGSTDPDTKDWLKQADGMDGIRVLLHDAPFNWSEMNNCAVENSDAEYFLFLNNDTISLDTGWDHILRGYLNRDDVGMVGARLFFEDGTLQFAGYITDEKNIALKEAYRENPQRGGYRDRSKLTHRCTALIGAFLACRRDVFEEAGGFDAARFPIAFNDIDFCLTVGKLGYKNLYVPAISFNHLESVSRGYDAQDAAKAKREANERQLMREKWGDTLNSDPWYPPAFLPQEPTHSLLAAPKKATITKQA
ncbi:MAG: glycosyltransferase, partial [Kordiimonadaceae bacterium]|nr:glycosyltransferase [Kordiimonadaceae bacterium]